MALYVVGCSSEKAPGPQAAALKYAPRQHEALRTAFYAPDGLAFAGHDLAILSAEFGMLRAADAVPDYDRKMDRSRAAALAADADQFARFAASVEGHDEVVVYGGKLYREVVRTWAERLGVEVTELLGANRGCGDHFQALQDHFADMEWDA